MKERSILFSGPLVKAILAGRKTQTRRLVKPEPHAGVRPSVLVASGIEDGHGRELRCSFGEAGDHLYVRETHAIVPASAYRCSREEDGSPVPHRVSPDGTKWAIYREGWTRSPPQRWRPSIHMPRWASRIDLEITDVRVERLQEITEEDARAEGVVVDAHEWDGYPFPHRRRFATVWDSINGAGSWEASPWVWVVAFRRVERAARAA